MVRLVRLHPLRSVFPQILARSRHEEGEKDTAVGCDGATKGHRRRGNGEGTEKTALIPMQWNLCALCVLCGWSLFQRRLRILSQSLRFGPRSHPC